MNGFIARGRDYDKLRQFFEKSEEVRVVIQGTREEIYRFTLDTKYFNVSREHQIDAMLQFSNESVR